MAAKPDLETILRREDGQLQHLRRLVSLTTQLLLQRKYSRRQAEMLVDWTRSEALKLFPDRELAFELIYGAKFDRLLRALYGRRGKERVH